MRGRTARTYGTVTGTQSDPSLIRTIHTRGRNVLECGLSDERNLVAMIPKLFTPAFVKSIQPKPDDAGEVDQFGELVGLNITLHSLVLNGKKGVTNRSVRIDGYVFVLRWADRDIMCDDDLSDEIRDWLDLMDTLGMIVRE